MILLGGIPSETPLAMVAAVLDSLDKPYVMFNQRQVARCTIDWRLDNDGVAGTLTLDGMPVDLAAISAAYLRLMDDRLLPEIETLPPDAPQRRHARGFHDALVRWAEVTPACVINRAEPQASNMSKPYQAQLIAAHGLGVPETLITSDPAQALDFRAVHREVIYKSISAVRSIVHTLEEADLDRLERIRACPVQFQQRLAGIDVRVHVIGSTAIATEIVSTHVDYRYASRQGGEAALRPTTVPAEISERCIEVARALGLDFAGIDLKHTLDDEWFCFEVNPSPAFSYFEANTDQPIALTLARYLAAACAPPQNCLRAFDPRQREQRRSS
jgi:glutathione synthase/RimK-type ligase-like ATP-grasp enzyme